MTLRGLWREPDLCAPAGTEAVTPGNKKDFVLSHFFYLSTMLSSSSDHREGPSASVLPGALL